MAEVVGAVASILTIVGAGAKLSILLFEFSSTLGSAGSEIQQIGIEISLFCSVLKQLESTLTKAKGCRYSLSAFDTTTKILTRCSEIFNAIESILLEVKGKGKYGDVDWKARVKWAFKKGDVKVQRATLESCKITLHLMLTTMDFAQKIANRRISTIETEREDEDERIMTRSLLIARQSTVNTLENLEEEQARQSAVVDAQLTSPIERRPDWLTPAQGYKHQGWHRQSRSFDGGRPSIAELGQDIVKKKRASAWLNDLLFDTRPLPAGFRRQTWGDAQCSTFLSQQHYQLLHKWTILDEERSNVSTTKGESRDSSSPLDKVIDSDVTETAGRLFTTAHPQDPNAISAPGTQDQNSTVRQTHENSFLSEVWEERTPAVKSYISDMPPNNSKIVNDADGKTISERRDIAISKLQIPSIPKPTTKLSSSQSEVSKPFRVSLDDPTSKVLPVALKKYNIQAPPENYCLYIVHGDKEILCGPNDFPLLTFKALDREGRKPMFMLRKKLPEDPLQAAVEIGKEKRDGNAPREQTRSTPDEKPSGSLKQMLEKLLHDQGIDPLDSEVEGQPQRPKSRQSESGQENYGGGSSKDFSLSSTEGREWKGFKAGLKGSFPPLAPEAGEQMDTSSSFGTKMVDKSAKDGRADPKLKEIYGIDDLSKFLVSHGRSRKEFTTHV